MRPPPKTAFLKRQLVNLPAYLCLILWTLFTLVTVGWIIAASFSTTKEIFNGELFKFASGVHTENYVKVWNQYKLSTFFINSLIYTSLSCSIVLFIAAPAGYALSRFNFKWNKSIQNMFVAGLGIPSIMIVMPIYYLAAKANLLNSRAMLVILYVGTLLPFTVYYLMAFFKNISSSFEEAALIDGCSYIGAFWKIMLPLARPGIFTVTIFNFISIWNEYFMALIFASNQSMRSLAVGLYSMIQSMKYIGDWAGLFTIVVIVFLPTLILYLVLSNRILGDTTAGGIKG